MHIHAFRLPPGADLKPSLTDFAATETLSAGAILTGIGSLSAAVLRFAGQPTGTTLTGDFEILTLAGTISQDGIHLHISIADAEGRVWGGHLMDGCIVRTTAEIVVAALPDLHFARVLDDATGYKELVVSPVKSIPPEPVKMENVKAETVKVEKVPPVKTGVPTTNAFILHTDGASKGNPGPSGIGIALFRANDLQTPVAAIAEYIGETTNNVAEYMALIRGLKEAILRGVEQVEVRTDSQLMAQQVSGKYKVNAPQIQVLHSEATKLLARFARAKVVYVPRAENALADKLANQGVASRNEPR